MTRVAIWNTTDNVVRNIIDHTTGKTVGWLKPKELSIFEVHSPSDLRPSGRMSLEHGQSTGDIEYWVLD